LVQIVGQEVDKMSQHKWYIGVQML
jgi:hypothetical protein